MKINIRILIYSSLAVLLFCLDRITKQYALNLFSDTYSITSFLSYTCVINRGIVGGLCNSSTSALFVSVSFVVIALYSALGVYTLSRYRHDQSIIGEVLVLTGGLSNIVDRFVCKGVIDFILFSYKGWSWPVFNIADVVIVFGVLIMLFTTVHDV